MEGLLGMNTEHTAVMKQQTKQQKPPSAQTKVSLFNYFYINWAFFLQSEFLIDFGVRVT